MRTIPVEVSATANQQLGHTFLAIAPIDLTTIFTGHLGLPAVVDTTDQVGGWNTEGETRTVHLADGSTAREHLTHYDLPNGFGYTVSDFSGSLRMLAREARGRWWFEADGGDRTTVRWRYEFVPTTPIAFPVLWLIARLAWSGYMSKAINLAIRHAE